MANTKPPSLPGDTMKISASDAAKLSKAMTSSTRTTAGIAGKNGANVASINKPSAPAAHTSSPIAGAANNFGVSRAQAVKNAANDPVIKQLEANQKKYMPGAKPVTSMTPVKKSK